MPKFRVLYVIWVILSDDGLQLFPITSMRCSTGLALSHPAAFARII